MGEQWYNLRSDALADFRIGQRHMRFWLEWDRGTMNVRDLAIKCTAYAHFVAAREWAREDASVPRLAVLPRISRKSNAYNEWRKPDSRRPQHWWYGRPPKSS